MHIKRVSDTGDKSERDGLALHPITSSCGWCAYGDASARVDAPEEAEARAAHDPRGPFLCGRSLCSQVRAGPRMGAKSGAFRATIKKD